MLGYTQEGRGRVRIDQQALLRVLLEHEKQRDTNTGKRVLRVEEGPDQNAATPETVHVFHGMRTRILAALNEQTMQFGAM